MQVFSRRAQFGSNYYGWVWLHVKTDNINLYFVTTWSGYVIDYDTQVE